MLNNNIAYINSRSLRRNEEINLKASSFAARLLDHTDLKQSFSLPNFPELKIDHTCILEVGFLNVTGFDVPFFECYIPAGHPSDTDDTKDPGFDLMDHLVRHPHSTYFVRAKGYSMMDAGIYDKDILVVDTKLEPQHGSIVMAVVNGVLTIKRLHKKGSELMLVSDNPDFPSIPITKDMSFFIQGVVTSVIRHFNLIH